MEDKLSFKDHFEDFLDATEQERTRARTRRDYRDLKQWTDEEVSELNRRGQAAIVFDYFAKKIDAFSGMEVMQRTDPKAIPRTPIHEKCASVITEALRYCEEQTHFDEIASEVFEDKIVEGYGAAIIEINKKTLNVDITQIKWDRFYFDPKSRQKDFSDSEYFGITTWMNSSKVKRMWPDANVDQMMNSTLADGTDFEDKPTNWVDKKAKRVRINQEYFLADGVWHEVYYSGDVILDEPHPSPYLDDAGEPMCPIEAQSDFVDRDNNRYGYSQRLIDPQNEINHRRSKALHMLSSKSLIIEKGALGSTTKDEVLDELKKAQSVIEVVRGSQFQIDNHSDMGNAQVSFYQDSLNAMNSVGVNPELSTGTTEGGPISGRAFIARQQGGMNEVARIFSRHSNWKKRVYRQIWSRIKQFWTDEKWLRITDDANSAQWVGINIQVKAIDKLIEDQYGEKIDVIRTKNPEIDQLIGQAIQQNPILGKVVEVRNNVAEIDVDIMIEDVPDTISIQQEQFEALTQLAASRDDPQMFKALLSISTIHNKEKVLQMLEGDMEAQIAAQQQAQQMTAQRAQAEFGQIQSQTAKNMADAQLKEAQTKETMAGIVEQAVRMSSPIVQNY